MTARIEAFRAVRLPRYHAEAALGLSKSSPDVKAVLTALAQVRQTLQAVQGNIDEKIAEYAFFPLSHVLKASNKLPARALELCLENLVILLRTGWRRQMPPELCSQLLILLTFLAAGHDPKDHSAKTSEDLQILAFGCLAELWQTAALSAQCRASLLGTANVPALGHSISVTLDVCSESPSAEVQLAAITSLQAAISAINDRDTLASFLPGIVSSLTKLITPGSRRQPFRVIEKSINAISALLKLVISDSACGMAGVPSTDGPSPSSKGTGKLDATWLKATSGQIKQALANVARIKKHERKEVRKALLGLSMTVLKDCENTLSELAGMMVEVVLALSASDLSDEAEAALLFVLRSNLKLADSLKMSLHSWVVSLPRIMLSHDDDAKQTVVQQISVAYRVLQDEHVDLAVVDRVMASNLLDSVANSMKTTGKITETDSQPPSTDLIQSLSLTTSTSFDPIVMANKDQEKTSAELQHLLKQLSASEASRGLLRDLVESARNYDGSMQISSFWLARKFLDLASQNSFQVSDFIDFGPDQSSITLNEASEELYALSLAVLGDTRVENNTDWRLQALSLETVASQAVQLGTQFRAELIEVLYPVLHLMGSHESNLRRHAFTCLNIISSACGYDSASSMIIDNTDYLTNSVAIKLNTFEISPQAPQVLLMMIRLAGPSLIPYLDDLIGSIFAALEYYHGYPKLVELLFGVLKAVAEEGTKSSQLRITPSQDPVHKQNGHSLTSVDDVARTIKELQASMVKDDGAMDVEPFPERPWKANEDKDGEDGQDDPMDVSEGVTSQKEDPPPPAPKTYNLLLSIAKLTQHYLTSASPSLRTSLLSLLETVFPSLSLHENSFLPLINTLWPVIVPRLEDPEAYVIANTLDVIGMMCVYGGDFMRTRIDEIWSKLFDLNPWKKAPKGGITASQLSLGSKGGRSDLASSTEVSQPKPGTSSDLQPFYVDSPSRMIWESLVRLFISIAKHLAIDDEKFDDMLDFVEPVLLHRDDVKEALTYRNADSVWLRVQRIKSQQLSNSDISGPATRRLLRPMGKHSHRFAELKV